jgi:serine/threonine-protein kinase
MASVRHVNVVRIYTSGDHDGLPFFVMEHVRGCSVAALIRRRFGDGESIPLETLLVILDQVSLGLSAMHGHGIFHGDVKPANMLIGERGHVAITDFGLVGSSSAGTSEGIEAYKRYISGGTPLYIAPELIAGKDVPPTERHLCDAYSLGVSLFEMFTGKGPFEGHTVDDVLEGHLHASPPKVTRLRPDLPPVLNLVLRRALAKRPHRRYPSCEELAFAVNRAVRERAA